MTNNNLILDKLIQPTAEAIEAHFNKNIRGLWRDLNNFIQTRYQATPKMDYSSCSLQKGWNIKYKKADKSLCTLYPADDHFYILIVIKTELAGSIEAWPAQFEPAVIDIIKSAKPMNGTYWLMIKVDNQAVLNNVKDILLIKQPAKN